MKILFITDLYPVNTGESKTPRTLHNFVTSWKKLGHEVDVIIPNFVFNSFLREKPYRKNGFYEHEGVKILNLNFFTPFFFDIFKKIPEDFDFKAYDLVIAHMPAGIIFANKLIKKVTKPLICGVHISDIEVMTKPIYSTYFKKQLEEAYKNAKRIACRSFILQKKFCDLIPECAEKTFVATSGVNMAQEINSNYSSKNGLQSVITCSKLIKRKNIDKLISAVGEMENFELKIIGEGRERKKLEKLNKKNVVFLGQLSHELVIEEMQKADIFVLPSVNETFGLVYLEAMASGCITVGTRNDGIDGIIKDGENGFLCEPTKENLKEVLLKIKQLENPEKMLENGFDTIKELSPEICAKKYLENCKI